MTYEQLDLDRAWAAGLYDGEGSTSPFRGPWVHGKARIYVRCHLGQKDPGVLLKFHSIVKVGSIRERVMNRAPFHDWTCQTMKDVLTVENLLWPHLGEVKRNQLRRAIEATTLISGNFKEKTT